jgi:hypothetical protein
MRIIEMESSHEEKNSSYLVVQGEGINDLSLLVSPEYSMQ